MSSFNCWLCDSNQVSKIKEGIDKNISPEDFNITDDRYGVTLPIYRCMDCKFEFCPEPVDLDSMYNYMEDDSYIESSKSRSIQAKKIAKYSSKFIKDKSKILDIGCGSGLLVKEFKDLDYEAYGLEPSKFLAGEAKKNNLSVYHGTLENYNFLDEFDLVTLIDVIEHVQNPVGLLNQIRNSLKEGGYLLIITPKRDSFFRFILGFKWWHYRIAHVGYFSKSNLINFVRNAGYDFIDFNNPTWFLPLDYILNRIFKYFPLMKYQFKFSKEISVPINLFDSSMILVKKKEKD